MAVAKRVATTCPPPDGRVSSASATGHAVLTTVRLLDLARDWKRIHSQERDRFALWKTHVSLALGDRPRHVAGQAKVLDFRVGYLDYLNLVHLFREIFVGGVYDLPVSTNAPVIFDCGSNIGMSILYFKHRYPSSRIVGFEPHPHVYETLQRNVSENGLRDVTLHRRALAAREGEIEFFAEGSASGALNMGLFADRNHGTAIKVEASPLSKYLTESVDLLKLDIEGAEESVLEELAAADALRHVRHIVCEYHHHLDPARDHLSRSLAILESQGFGYVLGAHPPPPRNQPGYQDVLVYAYRKS